MQLPVISEIGWSRLMGLPLLHDELNQALATHTIHVRVNSSVVLFHS